MDHGYIAGVEPPARRNGILLRLEIALHHPWAAHLQGARSHAVAREFPGRVVKVDVPSEATCRAFWAGIRGQVYDDLESSWHACGAVATMRVTRSWKGKVGPTATVVTDWRGCGLPFRVGDEYLIYALSEGRPDAYSSSRCRGSRLAAEAQADLVALGPPRTP